MEAFEPYLMSIKNEEHCARMREVLEWIQSEFPDLETKIAWNQPMFTDHGTFIIAFSASKGHFSVAPEEKAIEKFASEIEKSGYSHRTNIFRIRWNEKVDFALLEKVIRYNRMDKADCATFWRK